LRLPLRGAYFVIHKSVALGFILVWLNRLSALTAIYFFTLANFLAAQTLVTRFERAEQRIRIRF
jgi:hypothetical protein